MNNGHGTGEPVSLTEAQEIDCEVRVAEHGDVPQLVAGVAELLQELGGNPASAERLEAAAHELIDAPEAGLLVVAESGGEIVGVLGASWQCALRVPGRYGLIQELWVARDFRYKEIGTELLNELIVQARERDVQRLEVGLPSERYPHLAATESFYETHDFKGIGLRMRRQL